jgi:rhamnosyltransferase
MAVETSVLILCKNEERHIGDCLSMVFDQDYESEYEVVVVDSGSTDRTLDIVHLHPVRLYEIPATEFHHARTRNYAAGLSRGRNLVYLTADAVPFDRTWLRNLVGELAADDVAGAYGRQLPWPSAYPMEKYFLNFLYGPYRRVQRWQPGNPLDMETTLFSNVTSAIKKELWEHEPWSDAIDISEDQVWSKRMLEAGYAIAYNPNAAVYHTHNYSLKRAFQRFYDSGRSSYESYLPSDGGGGLRFIGNAGRYAAGEVKYLVENGQAAWLPRAAVYESTKFLGLLAGRLSARTKAA